jgi:hypothetical protein
MVGSPATENKHCHHNRNKEKLKGTKDLEKYVMVYSGVEQKKRVSSGVAILIDQKWKNKIESYIYVNYRILKRFQIERGHLTVIGIYAPEEGRVDGTKVFYAFLQKQLQNISKGD